MRLLLSVAVAAAIAATLTVVGLAGSARPAGAALQTLNVVTVGDSYASGEGARGSAWIEPVCHQSAFAGHRDAAFRLANRRATSFTFLACSGATTSGMLGSQFPRIPAGRVDALTMSIGGNDIGFAGIVTNCANMFSDCRALDATATTAIRVTLPPRLDGVMLAVPPGVRNVFVTEYPDPTSGPNGLTCGTGGPTFGTGLEGVTGAEALWASTRVVAPLNAELAAAVARANARPGPHAVFHFVSGISARFATRGYCSGSRFVNTVTDSLVGQADVFGTMHPNVFGQRAIGDALFSAISFVGDEMVLSVSTAPSPPIVSGPALVTARVRTSAGTPVPGAVISIDGASVGTTDQAGALTVTSTFATAGLHEVRAATDPYPDDTVSVSVGVNDYVVSSNPSPIPMGTIGQLSLRADNPSTSQLVTGTFVVESAAGTFHVQSGLPVTNVTITPGSRLGWACSLDPGWPGCRRIIETVCPTITFRPALTAYPVRDVSSLVACSPWHHL